MCPAALLQLGLYLEKASIGSAYGAAGSVVVLLVWVYYSAQLFFVWRRVHKNLRMRARGVCLNIEPETDAAEEDRREKLPRASSSLARPINQQTGQLTLFQSIVSRGTGPSGP